MPKLIIQNPSFKSIGTAQLKKIDVMELDRMKLLPMPRFQEVWSMKEPPYVISTIDTEVIKRNEKISQGLFIGQFPQPQVKVKDFLRAQLPKKPFKLKTHAPAMKDVKKLIAKIQFNSLAEHFNLGVLTVKPKESAREPFGVIENYYGYGISLILQQLDKSTMDSLWQAIEALNIHEIPYDLQFHEEGKPSIQIVFRKGERLRAATFDWWESEVKAAYAAFKRENKKSRPTVDYLGKLLVRKLYMDNHMAKVNANLKILHETRLRVSKVILN